VKYDSPGECILVSYAAVLRVVTQRYSAGALRDERRELSVLRRKTVCGEIDWHRFQQPELKSSSNCTTHTGTIILH